MVQRRKVIPIVLITAAIALISFGVMSVLGSSNSVTGQVVSVEQASVTRVSKLTIEDDSGQLWTFEGSGSFAGFTPSHLEEHRALREQVTVEYEETDSGDFRILGLSD